LVVFRGTPARCHMPPSNNMLIVTSTFKPEAAVLLPRQHHAYQPTPATTLTPPHPRRHTNNAKAHLPPPSSLHATAAPPTPQHAYCLPPSPTTPPCGHCVTATLTMPRHARHCRGHSPSLTTPVMLPQSVDLSKVGGCVGGVRVVHHRGIYCYLSADDCSVCGDPPDPRQM
jgi:hypothetical protein